MFNLTFFKHFTDPKTPISTIIIRNSESPLINLLIETSVVHKLSGLFCYVLLHVITLATGARRLDSFFFFFFFFAFSPVWRPLRYVHAIILPLKPFLSILNQPSSMGYYIDKVGNAVS